MIIVTDTMQISYLVVLILSVAVVLLHSSDLRASKAENDAQSRAKPKSLSGHKLTVFRPNCEVQSFNGEYQDTPNYEKCKYQWDNEVIQRIRKYKGQRASELNVGDPQQQRDRPQQTFSMSQAEENQRYQHQHEHQNQQKHLPDSAQSWNEEQRNDLHQNNNQYEHYSSGRLHDQDHSQALSTQNQNSVQNDASGLQPVLGRDSPYNQSHPERPPSPQPSNHQNQTSYSYRQSESARRLNKLRSPNKNDKTTPSPYTKNHSLPILVKIDADCFWRYDSSDKLPSKLCSPMNSIDVAFELESDRCRLKYNGLSYEAFVGNCETIDGMIGFNDRCKVVSYNSKRKDNKLFDECKRRWDLTEGMPISFDKAYMVENDIGEYLPGECLQTFLTSKGSDGTRLRRLAKCDSILIHLPTDDKTSRCSIVANTNKVVPCNFDDENIVQNNRVMLVQEVLSAIEDYQNRDSDQRQKKRLAAQMSYRQELIIPKRVNSRQTNIRRRSLQPGSRNKSRRIRFNFLKEENLKYVNVLTLPMCNERSANYAKMSIPHAIKYLEKFEKTEFSERNIFIYSVNNGIYTEVGQCPSNGSCVYCTRDTVCKYKYGQHCRG